MFKTSNMIISDQTIVPFIIVIYIFLLTSIFKISSCSSLYNKMQITQATQNTDRRYITVTTTSSKPKHVPFQFPSYQLAFQVRETVYLKLIEFDENNDQEFQEEEIKQFLIEVLHQNQQEIHYFIRNVFRYDYNNDGIIEYDQLVNFCMEQHFGELAIQRLHRKKTYHKGSQRIMNMAEFVQTVKYALSFIHFTPQENDLKEIFEVVDVDKDGFISYEDYFRFLKEYFGSKSFAAKMVHKGSVISQLNESINNGQAKGIDLVKKYSKYEGQDLNKKGGTKIMPNRMELGGNKPQGNYKGLSNGENKQAPFQFPKNNPQAQTLAQLIARLVLTQLKSTLVYFDSQQSCSLSGDDILNYTQNTYRSSGTALEQSGKRMGIDRSKRYSYEQATIMTVNQHVAKVFREWREKKKDRNVVNVSQFGEIGELVCGVNRNTPLKFKYDKLYKSCYGDINQVSLTWAQKLFTHIFNHFFPSKQQL